MMKSPREKCVFVTVLLTFFFSIFPFYANAENTGSVTYTDTSSGVSFVIPRNWVQKEMSQERQYLTAKFVSNEALGNTILFGATDVWNQLSSSEKMGYNRKDINNDYFAKSDIAEMMGITENDISIAAYNGVQYYQSNSTVSQEIYGIAISVDMEWLMHIENGWMYLFLYSGTDNRDSFSDFESLLNSVVYPTASDIEVQDDDKKTVFYVFGILIIATIVLLLLVIIFHNHHKSSPKVLDANTAIKNPSFICKNCGQALPSDSSYCHNCGSKVNSINL